MNKNLKFKMLISMCISCLVGSKRVFEMKLTHVANEPMGVVGLASYNSNRLLQGETFLKGNRYFFTSLPTNQKKVSIFNQVMLVYSFSEKLILSENYLKTKFICSKLSKASLKSIYIFILLLPFLLYFFLLLPQVLQSFEYLDRSKIVTKLE